MRPSRFPGLQRVVDRLHAAIGSQVQPLREHAVATDEQFERIALRLAELERQVDVVREQLSFAASQLAALEQRVADEAFDRRVADVGAVERDLVEAIAAEHRRVRVRMQAMSDIEERLRRLESATKRDD